MFRMSFGAAAQAAAFITGVCALPLSQAVAADVACTLPGELVSEDASGDAAVVAAPDPVPGHDVLAVYVSQPTPEKMVFTLKVDTLSPTAPPNTQYFAYFTGDDGVPRYFTYDPYAVLPDSAPFTYGHTEPGPGGVGQLTEDGVADPESNAAADGTIEFHITRSRISTLEETAELGGIYGDARALIGAAGTGLVTPVDDSPAGFYSIRDADACGKSGAAKSSGLVMGGGLGFGLLAPLALLGLRRRALAAAVLSVLAAPALAADPASGTVTPEAPELTYTFPLAPLANASGLTGLATNEEAYECSEPQFPCDEFELTISLPAGFMEKFPDAIVRVAAATTEQDLDIDLQVADESGNVKYVVRDNPPEQPTARIVPADGAQKFIVQVTHGTPHTGGSVTVRLEPGDAAKSGSGGMLGGAAGAGLLAALAGLALIRRRGR